MSWDNIHVGDYGWVGTLQVVQDDTPVDISSYTTLKYVFRKPDGTQVEKTAVFDDDGTDGTLAYTAEDGVFDTAGEWRVRVQMAKTGVELTSHAIRFRVLERV